MIHARLPRAGSRGRATRRRAMEPGTAVRIKGLVKAAQHNGKLGRLSARKGEDGRVGVQLRDGQVL